MDAQDFTFCTCVATVLRRGCTEPSLAEPIVRAQRAREPPPAPEARSALDERRREAAARLGARPQAQPGRAAEAREGAARDPRRAARADRAGLRERRRGGHRPAPVVGPLPRQAEDRDVHAPRQGARRAALGRASCARSARSRTSTARATASSRPARTSSCTGSSSRSCPTSSRTSSASGIDDRRRLRRHRPQHHRLPGPGDRRRRALRRDAGRRRRRRPLLRQPRLGEPAAEAQVLDLRLRRPLQRARDQLHLADRHRHDDGREGFAVLVGGGLSSVPRIARDMGVFIPKEDANEILGAITTRLVGGPQVPRLARQGAAQVHGRRHRPRGHPRARRGAGSAASSRTTRCRRSTSSRRTTSASTRRSRRASPTSACPCTSA